MKAARIVALACAGWVMASGVGTLVCAAQDVKGEDAAEPVQPQVEIEYRALEFKLADVEELARREPCVSAESLLRTWKAGKGRLVGIAKVVSQPGVEATAKDAIEHSYPTGVAAFTNAVETNVVTVVPDQFETREIGIILTVLPEVSANRKTVTLTLAPEIVELEELPPDEAGGTRKMSSDGVVQTLRMPEFHRQCVSTTVRLNDGGTVVLGGGGSAGVEGLVTYHFVTARLIGDDGKPIAAQ